MKPTRNCQNRPVSTTDLQTMPLSARLCINLCEGSCRPHRARRLTPPPREYLFSPNGAAPYQPRAERSAALGWITKWNPALKGRPIGGAARDNGSPLQGFGTLPTPTQGDALGWYRTAPLGLNNYPRKGGPGERRAVLRRLPLSPLVPRGERETDAPLAAAVPVQIVASPDWPRSLTRLATETFKPALLLAAVLWMALTLMFPGLLAADAAEANKEAWAWKPSLVPKALVIEGLWTDYFRVTPALHDAGIRYHQSYVSRSPYFGGYTRFYHLPTAEELKGFSIIVIANLDAPSLNAERLKVYREFVAQGGGLVVLGGYWAFSRGAYAGTPLEEMLPVAFAPEHRIPETPEGLPLHPSAQATWKPAFELKSKPVAFYVQTLTPKPESTVQWLAGDKPALISGSFGKGRVVACALTANGETPAGVLPFWDWPEWPKVLGQALDWAAGARPTVSQAKAATKPSLSDEEMSALTLGGTVTPDMARRISERPNAETAEALFQHVMRPEGGGKVDLAMVAPTLLPFVRVEWGVKLRESLKQFNPDLKSRQAALMLLGASRDPAAYPQLVQALPNEETKEAAMNGLGRLGRPEAIPLIQKLLQRAEAACKVAASEDIPGPGVFAADQGSTIVEAAIALFRLGEPEAVPRMLEVYARVHLLHRIFENAVKRRVADTDLQGIGILKRLHQGLQKLSVMQAKLRAEAGPVPETQRAAFLKAAAEAKEPVAVEWLCFAMEQSTGVLPATTWEPLTKASDGIIARMSKRLAGER